MNAPVYSHVRVLCISEYIGTASLDLIILIGTRVMHKGYCSPKRAINELITLYSSIYCLYHVLLFTALFVH